MAEAEGGEFALVARECEVVLAELSELDPQVCMHACMYLCICICICTRHTHAQTHVDIYIHIDIYLSDLGVQSNVGDAEP